MYNCVVHLSPLLASIGYCLTTQYLTYLSGKLIHLWLLSHCIQCETKCEYYCSQQELHQFLALEETVKVLRIDCINHISSLQDGLRTKEFKLTRYIRMDMRNYIGAGITSPMESNNNYIKHGLFAVHLNKNLDKSTQQMIDGFSIRLCY